LVDEELGEVDEVAQIFGSDKFILDCPLTMPRVARGDGEESGDEVSEDTYLNQIPYDNLVLLLIRIPNILCNT
jgi:hypothetical protein